MIQLQPESRKTAAGYLQSWDSWGFDASIPHLHKYISKLTKIPSPSERIVTIKSEFPALLQSIAHTAPSTSEAPTSGLATGFEATPPVQLPDPLPPAEFHYPIPESGSENVVDTKDVLELNDLIIYLENECESSGTADEELLRHLQMPSVATASPEQRESQHVYYSDTPTWQSQANDEPGSAQQLVSLIASHRGRELPGMTIILSVLCNSIRNAPLVATRSIGLWLLHLAAHVADMHCRMDILLPYMIFLVHDPAPSIRACAINAVASLLEGARIDTRDPSNKRLFLDYVLPAMSHLAVDREEAVRVAFALHLGSLASSSRRMLEGHFLGGTTGGGGGSSSSSPFAKSASSGLLVSSSSSRGREAAGLEQPDRQYGFDSLLQEIEQWFSHTLTIMFSDGCSAMVKRALLRNVAQLAEALGVQATSEFLLPFLTTFLNDNDWRLRRDFFVYASGLSRHLDKNSIPRLLFFCLSQGLVDLDEVVMADALHCVTALVSERSLPRSTLLEILQSSASLLCHPNRAIRIATAALIHALSVAFGQVDSYCYMLPVIRPYLSVGLIESHTRSLTHSLPD